MKVINQNYLYFFFHIQVTQDMLSSTKRNTRMCTT